MTKALSRQRRLLRYRLMAFIISDQEMREDPRQTEGADGVVGDAYLQSLDEVVLNNPVKDYPEHQN